MLHKLPDLMGRKKLMLKPGQKQPLNPKISGPEPHVNHVLNLNLTSHRLPPLLHLHNVLLPHPNPPAHNHPNNVINLLVQKGHHPKIFSQSARGSFAK